ncbi:MULTISPECIES: four helix bundle protein [unclassified Fibrobacter]|uniref:four helix bundle protein n=1 Tax=unclassified Fibrobacter TaxID=2634177 RepID=UPI000D6D0B28|nr:MULTISPECIES: four helix bundle protein [unclassified Fibrobacter]PWJ67062.1 four helix bundle protein [Fibrobacter sp. UWR4]PZW70629.1 four helix bundle protein [Fibrobacter sp. UWR1]
MRDFHSLDIWKKSHELTLDVYRVTETFPKNEIFALTSQVRRAAYSIPMNIAEGCGRKSEAEFCQFLNISSGSASELEYQMLLARDLGYLDSIAFNQLSEKVVTVRKMICSFASYASSLTAPKARPRTSKPAESRRPHT